MNNATYSFADVQCSYQSTVGGGNFPIAGQGVAEEGIDVEFEGDKGTLTPGADGGWMHSLHAAQPGRITVRLLKTSPANQLLSALYNFETTTAANYGYGTLSLRNLVTGDVFTARGAGLQKFPTNRNAKEGGTIEWVFNCGWVDPRLGSGSPSRN